MKLKKTEVFSKLHRLYLLFRSSFEALNLEISEKTLEDLSICVHEVMTARWRTYHTPDHLFAMAEGAGPIETLAILFHDVVYFQVDRRIHPQIASWTAPFIVNDKSEMILPESGNSVCIQLVYLLFRVKAGQTLTPMTGLNEFLSTIVCVRALEPYLSVWQIAELITCIEGTIPFRLPKADGKTIPEVHFEVLSQAVIDFDLGVSSDRIESAVKKAVWVSNQDVAGFGSTDLAKFLDNTWKLILEGNAIFKNPLYTIQQYRSCLQKNEAFFQFLKPSSVFREFNGSPSKAEHECLIKQTTENLRDGTLYLQIKSLTICLLEAIAELTGGDAPLVLFMGDVPTSDIGAKTQRMETFLSPLKANNKRERNKIVDTLLDKGRSGNHGFDLKNSPLACYLYRSMSREEIEILIQKSKEYAQRKISADHLLGYFRKNLLRSVLGALAKSSGPRAVSIQLLERELMKKSR